MQQQSPEHSRQTNQPAPVSQVAPGIWKFVLPIPFPLRTVNVYALVGPDGWVLVDTALGTPDARSAFHAALTEARLHLDQLQAIVLTHHHPDHVGLSGELQARTGVPVYMHSIDEAAVQIIWTNTMRKRFERVSSFFAQHGLPETDLWYNQMETPDRQRIIDVPPHEAFTLVEDGTSLTLAGESYRVIWVPGHSDGQICLWRERDGIFLSADHVLPRITPNIGLYSTRDRPNPLGDFLASLQKVTSLPASLVLPGHGEPFTNLAQRIAEIVEHHDMRLQTILALLATRPQHAAALTAQLFQDRLKSDEARRMAVAEVLAHLEYLRYKNQVIQQLANDGTIRYSVV
ncbi:MBL fold metallo-hydrolase [Ktedonobacter robiniae]|uniref:MBL fold hydrolase n=1 Tax=Ktedonobacter robiniae TaxID=2778365 RepID=A0ABQ3UJU9_9CHLR|nr:MBL fold metallo-hydrolase [Ktedonobacter robiniae]GHO52974.1 MBL fold hydrolase [Ktedonobacter robiniae]